MSHHPYEPSQDPYRQEPPPQYPAQYPPQPYSPGPQQHYPPQPYEPQPYSAQPYPPQAYQQQPHPQPPYPPASAYHGHYRPQPGYGYQHPMVAPTSGWATASLVLGIIGLLAGWCLAGIPSLVAIVAGHIGLAETRTGARDGRGLAVGGLILGYLALIPGALVFFLAVVGWLVDPTPASP
jgi:hypothetical protein